MIEKLRRKSFFLPRQNSRCVQPNFCQGLEGHPWDYCSMGRKIIKAASEYATTVQWTSKRLLAETGKSDWKLGFMVSFLLFSSFSPEESWYRYTFILLMRKSTDIFKGIIIYDKRWENLFFPFGLNLTTLWWDLYFLMCWFTGHGWILLTQSSAVKTWLSFVILL